MNADLLLDAIGMVDDRFLISEPQRPKPSPGRMLRVLIAAILLTALLAGTALGVSTEFREWVFSLFCVETPETPPGSESWPTDATLPTDSGLQEFDAVDIDGALQVQYVSGHGWVFTYEGGFYTATRGIPGIAPADGVFWQIQPEGIEKIQTQRVNFPMASGERTLHITFDWAVLNGNLALQPWIRDLDQDPVGNGWNVEAIGSRTDVVLLTLPVLKQDCYTHKIYLLEMETLQARDLLGANTPAVLDVCQVTEDLRYGLLMGSESSTQAGTWSLADLEADTRVSLDQLAGGNTENPRFLDREHLIYELVRDNGRCDLIRYHIPTGETAVIAEHLTHSRDGYPQFIPIRNPRGGGVYGLLQRQEGDLVLLDLMTGARLPLTGLDTRGLTVSESPDGSHILLAWRDADGKHFTQLGLLDPESGALRLLTRQVQSGPEYLWGWLDGDTPVLLAPESDNETYSTGNYYIYIYDFHEPDSAMEFAPPPPEPADSDFVRIRDYIPDLFVELAYATEDNFTGQVIYSFTEPWLRYGTVKRLMQVQEELRLQGLSLKIWDAFRPAAAQFKLWEVYPNANYVANPTQGYSSHSRGNTVDLTLVRSDGSQVPMPTHFDDFTPLADRDYGDCSPEAAKNAMLLENLMKKYGFTGYWAEFWHYTDMDSYPVETSFYPE